jgi:hypothetical protein
MAHYKNTNPINAAFNGFEEQLAKELARQKIIDQRMSLEK